MGFTPLDPQLIGELLAGERDVLTPRARAEAEQFALLICPSCGARGAHRLIQLPRPRRPGAPIGEPQTIARCNSCLTEYDPTTKLIHREPPTVFE